MNRCQNFASAALDMPLAHAIGGKMNKVDREEALETSRKMWTSMNALTSEDQLFPAAEMASAINIMASQVESEDPESQVLCNSCGQESPSCEVNFFGVCNYCKFRS
jgi:hypothetical protein